MPFVVLCAEEHAKADSVPGDGGALMRFCQQCTRLHPVAEFDGARRSCRTALSKRRTRKRQEDSPRSGRRAAIYARCGGSSSMSSDEDRKGTSGSQGGHLRRPHPRQQEQQQRGMQRLLARDVRHEASSSASNSELAVAAAAGASARAGLGAATDAAQRAQLWAPGRAQAGQEEPQWGQNAPAWAGELAALPPVPAGNSGTLSVEQTHQLALLLGRLLGGRRLAPCFAASAIEARDDATAQLKENAGHWNTEPLLTAAKWLPVCRADTSATAAPGTACPVAISSRTSHGAWHFTRPVHRPAYSSTGWAGP
jgi:hypothetical protein